MDEFSERLAWARQRAGYSSPRTAADAFEWNQNTYKSHENGIRGKGRPPDSSVVRRYARAFGVDFVWLMTGEGSPDLRNVAKVVGRIGAGAEIEPEFEQVPEEGLFEIEADVSLPPGMIGFEVIGDSMWPRYDPGDIVIVPAEGTTLDAIAPNEEAAVRTEDGRRYLKRVLVSNGACDLESYNARPIRGVKLSWVSPVYTVVRARKWRKLNGTQKTKAAKVKQMSPR